MTFLDFLVVAFGAVFGSSVMNAIWPPRSSRTIQAVTAGLLFAVVAAIRMFWSPA